MGRALNREWEELCRRCGQCCFEKWIETGGRIRFTRVPCRHLDITSRQCRVYEKRFDVGEGCVQLTPENVAELHWLPADCAYVALLAGGPPVKKNERKTPGGSSSSRRERDRE